MVIPRANEEPWQDCRQARVVVFPMIEIVPGDPVEQVAVLHIERQIESDGLT